MINESRRSFFKTVLTAGAALAASAVGPKGRAEAAAVPATAAAIQGICLYVPSLGKATDFVEMMNERAPGSWKAQPLPIEMMDCYLETKRLYEEARGKANTFVGVVDPASFAVVREAIVDCGGGFHYVRYEERNRVTFSTQI